MRQYPQDPEFPKAAATHQYALYEARYNNASKLWHEFRHASENRWAEWVAQRTPFGQAAHDIQTWQQQRLYGSSWGDKPVEAEVEQKKQELSALLIQIDDHLHPADTRPASAITRELLKDAILLVAFVSVCLALAGALWRNPFQWPLIQVAIAGLCAVFYAHELWGFCFSPSRYFPSIPGLGEQRPNDLNLGDGKLYEMLDTLRLSPGDDVRAHFGNWTFFKHTRSLGLRLKPIGLQWNANQQIKFKTALPGEEITTNVRPHIFSFSEKTVPDLWNVGDANVEALPDGPCVFFVYSVNQEPNSEAVPLALLSLRDPQGAALEFFAASHAPYRRNAVLLSPLGILAGVGLWLSFNWTPAQFFETLWPSLISCGIAAEIAGLGLRAAFQTKCRKIITELALRDDYKQALLSESMRLRNPGLGHTDGRL